MSALFHEMLAIAIILAFVCTEENPAVQTVAQAFMVRLCDIVRAATNDVARKALVVGTPPGSCFAGRLLACAGPTHAAPAKAKACAGKEPFLTNCERASFSLG